MSTLIPSHVSHPNISQLSFRNFVSGSQTFCECVPKSTHRNLLHLWGNEEQPRRPLLLSLLSLSLSQSVFAVGLIDVMHESREAPLLLLIDLGAAISLRVRPDFHYACSTGPEIITCYGLREIGLLICGLFTQRRQMNAIFFTQFHATHSK